MKSTDILPEQNKHIVIMLFTILISMQIFKSQMNVVSFFIE